MNYVVDLNDYSPEVIKNFLQELERKTSIAWGINEPPTSYAPQMGFYFIGDEHNHLVMASTAQAAKLLTRSQFIEKMVELYPPKKQDIREYCKEHRVWAAKQGDNGYGWRTFKPQDGKPYSFVGAIFGSWKNDRGYFGDSVDSSKFTFPDVSWDKSLIAPDGSMPLLDMAKFSESTIDSIRCLSDSLNKEWQKLRATQKRADHFEVGKWYVNVGENHDCYIGLYPEKKKIIDGKPHKCTRVGLDSAEFEGLHGMWIWRPVDWIEVDPPQSKEPQIGKWYLAKGHEDRGPGQLKIVVKGSPPCLLYHPSWNSGHNAELASPELGLTGEHSYYYFEKDLVETDPPKAQKPQKPHRGDPIFVWDDGASDRIPATVRYFSRIDDDNLVRVLSQTEENKEDESEAFNHYRVYDASLVEVPRRKWPKE